MNPSLKRNLRSREWTWITLNKKNYNEIDYIPTKSKKTVKDVKVLNTFSTGSDHRLIRSKVLINLKTECYMNIKFNKNLTAIDTNRLKTENKEVYWNILRTMPHSKTLENELEKRQTQY